MTPAQISFQTHGYENLELSTQVLIAEALKRKIKVEILDPVDQFIKLQKGSHLEYIQKATKTSKDSYVVAEILGNKVVSKIILKKSGLNVPPGNHYFSHEDALKAFRVFKGKKIAIKPKNTNYGVGISILSEKFSLPEYDQAVKYSFQFDQTILIERFVEGMEARFLVIGKHCRAVLNRVPANVIGDGVHSIYQLVTIKNHDPRRGEGHKTPLERIQIGTVEKEILKTQKLTPKSIPAIHQKVFLRHNSNISTGGDSIDITDEVHPQYKRIAEMATKAVGAQICGVDIIAHDFKKKPSSKNYAILEVNYNPVLYFHNFPFQGKNRNVAKYVLDLLGF